MESVEAIQEKLKQHQQQVELLKQKLKEIHKEKGASSQDKDNPNSYPSTSGTTNKFKTYRKRPGTTEPGKEFEQAKCGSYALHLAISDEVEDFEMTSNNDEDGKFDDIGLKIMFKNGKSRRFLFQLKHKENRSINIADLKSESKNSDFGVKKYIDSIEEMSLGEDTVCILSTNCPTKIHGKIELSDGISFEQCDQFEFEKFLLNTKEGCQNAIFEVKLESLKQKFYFFTSQLNVRATEQEVNAHLRSLLQCDIYPGFASYMRSWWSGRFVLTKHDIIGKISELAFSPYMKTLTDGKCNQKTQSLKEIIMNFPLTIVEECGDEIVENIWQREEAWIDEDFSKARSKYGLKEHQTSTTFWYLEKVPLVVNLDHLNERTIKCVIDFLRKDTRDKKIVLIGKVSKTDFGQWETFASLWDIVKNGRENHTIMRDLYISLQGRGRISLENLVEVDADVAKLISTRELLRMSQNEYLLVGNQKELLPDSHIPRFISSITSATTTVGETEIFQHLKHPPYLLCAPPGMGKSTLMKALHNHSPPDCLAVYVSLINYNSFLATQPDFQTTLTHFLGTEATEDDLFNRLKKHFWHKRKLYLYLDGLDEVNSQHVGRILDFVKQASSQGGRIWISSRENLRQRIRQALNVVPMDIKELDREEQQEYIHNKLEKSYTSEEIGKISLAIFSSTDLNNSRNLLGIPLQLHIITEMFLNDRQIYENLERKNLFVLTRMYKIFFEGKIKFTFNKLVDKHQELQLGNVRYFLQAYEVLALKSCLHPRDYQRLNLKATEEEDFLHQLKTEGDKYGIIRTINAYDEVIFNHQSYAEYFAAAWLKKNPDKIRLLQDRMFSSEYENLRLLFDIILAENNPPHLAVIYQDIEQLENHIEGVGVRDQGGRTAFHLAFSCGQKYTSSFDYELGYVFYLRRRTREASRYMKMIERLLQEDRLPEEKDDLFGLDCVSYALQSRCLFPIETILERKLLNFEELEGRLYRYYSEETVAYCSAQFGYPNLLSGSIRKNQGRLESLMKVAVCGCEYDDIPTTKGNAEAVRILLENGAFLLDLRDMCYYLKNFDMLEIFIKDAIRYGNEKQILHRLVRNCPENHYEGIGSAIKKFDLCVNARRIKGDTPLHTAAETADAKILEVLIENGSDLNLPDDDGRNALHYAIGNNRPEVMELLLDRGSVVDAGDKHGTTPLHLASKEGKTGIVQMLLDHGADPKLADAEMNGALHYASRSKLDQSNTIPFLIGKGGNVNEQNQDGMTPLHLACKRGHLKNIEILLEKGANPRLADKEGNTALHLASKRRYFKNKTFRLLLSRNVDVNAKNREGLAPIHFAHMADNSENVNILLGKGGELDLNAKFRNGQTLLHMACTHMSPKVAAKLLTQGVDPNCVDNDGRNALYYHLIESDEYDKELVHSMINHDLNLDVRYRNGRTLLHIACLHGDVRNIRKLVQNDVNVLDKNRQSPLQFVAKSLKKVKEFVFEDLKRHLRHDIGEHEHESGAYTFGCEGCYIDLLRNLRQYDRSPNSMDGVKEKFLQTVGTNDRFDFFLEHIANSGLVTDVEDTSRCFVARFIIFEMMKYLLENGSVMDNVDKFNKTVIDYASELKEQFPEVVNLLRQHQHQLETNQ